MAELEFKSVFLLVCHSTVHSQWNFIFYHPLSVVGWFYCCPFIWKLFCESQIPWKNTPWTDGIKDLWGTQKSHSDSGCSSSDVGKSRDENFVYLTGLCGIFSQWIQPEYNLLRIWEISHCDFTYTRVLFYSPDSDSHCQVEDLIQTKIQDLFCPQRREFWGKSDIQMTESFFLVTWRLWEERLLGQYPVSITFYS